MTDEKRRWKEAHRQARLKRRDAEQREEIDREEYLERLNYEWAVDLMEDYGIRKCEEILEYIDEQLGREVYEGLDWKDQLRLHAEVCKRSHR